MTAPSFTMQTPQVMSYWASEARTLISSVGVLRHASQRHGGELLDPQQNLNDHGRTANDPSSWSRDGQFPRRASDEAAQRKRPWGKKTQPRFLFKRGPVLRVSVTFSTPGLPFPPSVT